MPVIHRLDDSLVNKIAAGEVIERPASVVKELLENALDAGASRIDVALEDGGSRLIRVTDDGGGIDAADLPLALAPHATSKIETVDDLFRVRTFGFRGEALASVASVSLLTIRSRPHAGPSGGAPLEAFEITHDEHGPGPVRPCSAPLGTTVEVRNLFYNVPARRKFLRHAAAELAHVGEQLARTALAHPAVAFSLSHHDRPVRRLPTTDDRRTRFADFFGPELAESLLPVIRDERGMRVEAWLAPPAHSKASTKWQYLFLNGRFILDRRIGFAIREAYRGLIENGRYPAVFIFLTMDPGEYDVNVHPSKIEVRWRDAGLVQSQVLAVLRETLLTHDLTPSLQTPARGGLVLDAAEEPRRSEVRQAVADYLKSIDPTQARLRFEPPRYPTPALPPRPAASYDTLKPTGSTIDRLASQSEQPAAPAPPCFEDLRGPPAAVQFHNAYLVAETDEGIIIVDQHALHERILYESFRDRLLTGPLQSQGLLMPATLKVFPAQADAIERHRTLLERLGIVIEPFGPGVIAIRSFPVLLAGVDAQSFVSDLLDQWADAGDAPDEETLVHRALDMMACKAAVKAGDPLSGDEIQALLAQRHLIDRSSNCPHGRPTTLQLSVRDLERQFKRT